MDIIRTSEEVNYSTGQFFRISVEYPYFGSEFKYYSLDNIYEYDMTNICRISDIQISFRIYPAQHPSIIRLQPNRQRPTRDDPRSTHRSDRSLSLSLSFPPRPPFSQEITTYTGTAIFLPLPPELLFPSPRIDSAQRESRAQWGAVGVVAHNKRSGLDGWLAATCSHRATLLRQWQAATDNTSPSPTDVTSPPLHHTSPASSHSDFQA